MTHFSFKEYYSPAFATKALLTAGIVAGIFVTAISYAQVFTRDGFDITRHANSQLALGDLGWMQTINFIVYGLLVLVFALGMRRVLKGAPGGLWAPILVAMYGLFGAVIVGLHPTDPAFGFPPGSSPTFAGLGAISASARIHGIAGSIGFTAMSAAAFVLTRYFVWKKQYWWAGLSFVTGLSVIVVTVYLLANANNQIASFNYIPVWLFGTLLWLYISLLGWKLLRDIR